MNELMISIPGTVLLCLAILNPCMVSAAEITVNINTDTGTAPGSCELRSAIEAANTDLVVDSCLAGSGADTILFSGEGVITLGSDLPEITESLVIQGTGFATTRIDGDGLYRQFNFASDSGSHEIRDLGLTKGFSQSAGGCVRNAATSLRIENVVMSRCEAWGLGGALWAFGNTSIFTSYFTSNTTSANGGAIFYGTGTYEITDTTFDSNNNTGDLSDGGAISMLGGNLTLLRITFYGNQANRQGGAIYGFGNLSIASSTIFGNEASVRAESGGNGGGGIYFFNGDLSLGNTVVAGNIDTHATSRPDISPGLSLTVTSNGSNLIGITTGILVEFPAGIPNPSGDFVGTLPTPLDPGLEDIANFGGPFPTMPPTLGSFVVDKGNCPGELRDQRGFFNAVNDLRVIDNPPANISDGCDIGSTELSLYIDDVFEDGFEQLIKGDD